MTDFVQQVKELATHHDIIDKLDEYKLQEIAHELSVYGFVGLSVDVTNGCEIKTVSGTDVSFTVKENK